MAATISQANSLNPGSELWATAQLEESQSSQRIDWYVNFQITKAKSHQRIVIPLEIEKVIRTCDLVRYDYVADETDGLLISANHLLPLRWLLVQPLNINFEIWVKKIYRYWDSLQKPALRIFLPANKTASEFQTHWATVSTFTDYGIVLDS